RKCEPGVSESDRAPALGKEAMNSLLIAISNGPKVCIVKNYRLKIYKNQARLMPGPFGHGYYTMVYAVHAPSCGMLKIGRTIDISKRFEAIQGASPVPVALLGFAWLPAE